MTTPFNAPVIPGMVMTPETVAWARRRPRGARTPLPVVGERVWFRADAHGPLVGAEVVAVGMTDETDLNVFRFVVHDPQKGPETDALGRRLMELLDDPWPSVTLKIDGVPGLHETREARLDGSPGWLRKEEGA